MSGLEKIYCSVPTQKSFLPSFMFPNSTVFFHTTLNSPTQLSAPCRATQEKCRSTSLKKFTRKCSKLARDAAQRLQNYPPFCQSATGKIRTALSPGALYPPFNVHCKFPYYQLVVVYVPTVTVALPKNYFVRDMHPTKITPRDF